MKTIAITMDEATLTRIDRLTSGKTSPWKSRSEVFRKAAEQFVNGLERAAEEEKEREIFRHHRARLNQQAVALIEEQANQ